MMQTLYKQKGASLQIEILADERVQHFISTHADVLNSSMKQVPMSDIMRQRLERSNHIFSGIKTFHQLNEAFPSLLDEKGNRKPFKDFLNDVRKIDNTYNDRYLEAEYNFVAASAEMAGKWEQFAADGDRYNLQYRTVSDDRVRPEHADMEGITQPIDSPFWAEFYPPNGWNCRCTVVQVRKSKYPVTPLDEAMTIGEDALGKDKKGVFRFNSGAQQTAIPQNHPYFPSSCQRCPFKSSIPSSRKKEMGANPEEKKDCYNCKYATQIIDERWVEVKKYPNGGSVQEHILTEKNKPDYNAIKHIANEFAKNGDEMKITPRLHRNSEEYKQIYATLTGTVYEGKCPDLSRNGVFYEYESYVRPFTKRKVGNMLSHGSKQSPYIIIDNNKGASDRFIRRSIINRIKVGQNPIKEVWLYEKGKLRLFFKDGQFFNPNTTGES